jgi:hypothetical protein
VGPRAAPDTAEKREISAISMVACQGGGGKPGIRSFLGFLENILIEQEVLGRTNRLLSFHYKLRVGVTTDRIENITTNSSIAVCIPGRGNVFTEPFPSNRRLL